MDIIPIIIYLNILEHVPTPRFCHIIISGDIAFLTLSHFYPYSFLLLYFSAFPQRVELMHLYMEPLEYALIAL
jgi:hypothetical protein